MLGRDWTWIDEEDTERPDPDSEEYEEVRARLDMLAKEWSSIHEAAEQRHFRRQAEAEEGFEPDFESQAEADAYYYRIEMKERLEEAKLAAIEDAMEKLGARMMRPYEHWGEEERMMEYLESRYDYED